MSPFRFVTLFVGLLTAGAVFAQAPGLSASSPAVPAAIAKAAADAYGRTNPRDTVTEFIRACQRGDYLRASEYLDLRQLPERRQRRQGMELALQLEQVINKDPDFDIKQLSDQPLGSGASHGRIPLELVDGFTVGSRHINVELSRVEFTPGQPVWVFSSNTVAAIPTLKLMLGENVIERYLPAVLVGHRFMGTALWQWIALLLLVPALSFVAKSVSRLILTLLTKVFRKMPAAVERFGIHELLGPVGLLLGVVAYSAGVALIAPSALVRFYLSRVLTLLAFMAVAWIIMRTMEVLSRRLHFTSDVRQQAMYSSVMPLGLRVIKIIIFAIAVVAVLSAWGYNTSTIWATLGVGSLAVALAAQKTLENFFGGVSVIGDRPVLVGDFCKVGDMVGTVEDIGLRSTRIRTLSRTIVTVPNSQFSTMTLENFAKRDRMWFHPVFQLRGDATPSQVRQVMDGFTAVLRNHSEVSIGDVPIRFTDVKDYSFTLEVFAYVETPNFDRYLQVQSELLLSMLEAVASAGTGLAVPVREVQSGPSREDHRESNREAGAF